MITEQLVACLLEDDTSTYVPDGYTLLDSAVVGDYELKLWKGLAHRKGEPIVFNEISLNRKGRSFDSDSQHGKYPGNPQALGSRSALLHTVARWIQRFGDLYIGSYIPEKVALYRQLFARYMPNLNVSKLYAPFDECDGKPEYFHVSAEKGVVESILREAADDVDAKRYVMELPSVIEKAARAATQEFENKAKAGELFSVNFGEIAEAIVNEVVDNFDLRSGDEVVDINTFNSILQKVLTNVRA